MSINQWHDALAKSVLDIRFPFESMRASPNEFTTDQRIDVYRNNYRLGLLSALELSYPNCKQIVGEKYFRQLASHYVVSHPPQDADLNQYGSAFSEFIKEIELERKELSEIPYLADLAALDWLLYQVYFSPNRNSWPADKFQVLTPEQQAACRLCLSADIHIISSVWPLYELWRLNRDEIDSIDLDAHSNEEFLVISRDNYQPMVEPVSEEEFAVLAAISEEHSIMMLTQQFPEYMDRLAKWIQSGWICDFKEPQADV